MFWSSVLLLPLCLAQASSIEQRDSLPVIRQVTQFPNQTWVENIAVRSNGKLLVTLYTTPELYQIDPLGSNPTPKLVARFPDVLGLLGITEIGDDVFAVAKGNFSSVTGAVDPRSFSVDRVDFRQTPPAVSTIANVPGATILNGLTPVKPGSRYLLAADSLGGAIWRIDMKTGKSDAVLNSDATQPAAPFPAGFGVNGVHTQRGHLYFTNTDKGLFSVPVGDDGAPAGTVKRLARFEAGDDFAFSARGGIYIAQGRKDGIQVLTPAGQLTPLRVANANAAVLLEGNTAVAFGRTKYDRRTLYVTTNGGLSGLVPGTVPVGGRVLAINLESGSEC
jgi:sugar lactone lactonase YvrE